MMTPQQPAIPEVGAILTGPYWPGRVRVVRVERRKGNRALVEAVTLDDASRLISRNFSQEELAQLQVESTATARTLDGDPLRFKLTAEATRIQLAHTYDPQFAVSVARIDPLHTAHLLLLTATPTRATRLSFVVAVAGP